MLGGKFSSNSSSSRLDSNEQILISVSTDFEGRISKEDLINIQSSVEYLLLPKKTLEQIPFYFGNDDILKINKNKNESTCYFLKGNKITVVNWLVLH